MKKLSRIQKAVIILRYFKYPAVNNNEKIPLTDSRQGQLILNTVYSYQFIHEEILPCIEKHCWKRTFVDRLLHKGKILSSSIVVQDVIWNCMASSKERIIDSFGEVFNLW